MIRREKKIFVDLTLEKKKKIDDMMM